MDKNKQTDQDVQVLLSRATPRMRKMAQKIPTA